MKIVLNPGYRHIHGRSGGIVIYNWRGITCARSRVIPRNPRTAAQQANREHFASISAAWKDLPEAAKRLYNFRASKTGRSMSGFNLYVSECMKGGMDSAAAVPETHGKRNLAISIVYPPDPLRMNTVTGPKAGQQVINRGRSSPAGGKRLKIAS